MALPQEYQNVLRQTARLCRAELTERLNGVHISQRDAIMTEVLDKHAATIKRLPSGTITPKSWLVHYIRLLSKE